MNALRYPLLRGLAKLCSDSCSEDLESLAREAEELESLASKLPQPRLEPGGGAPLASRVSNLDELLSVAGEVTGSMELARYLVARRIYLDLRAHAPRPKGARCSVCGSTPRLITLSRVNQGIFDGYTPTARCACGMEWRVDEWECPSCGSRGRGFFNIYIVQPGVLEVRECRSCGYRLVVTSVRPRQVEVLLVTMLLGG
ncbi:MAG: hypothetical protein F7B18_04900 [Desulfurococcales archaeon]|nr:hypothetical protein [Desulfurococcales archaeon]